MANGNKYLTRQAYHYELPPELIAQSPEEPRDSAKLMVIDRLTGDVVHRQFSDIVDYLRAGDLLVLNNSKVLSARIFGERDVLGGTVEFLLLNQISKDVWEALSKPGKKAKIGSKFDFSGVLNAEVIDIKSDGNRILKFKPTENFFEKLEIVGKMPTPPYIKQALTDSSKYQTVYAKTLGSVAAPTAGLHFTKNLLQKIVDMEVKIAYVTLHVGLGTFRPVKVDNILEHKMHTEYYTISQSTADLINSTIKQGNRIISVGTTTCRTLESNFQRYGLAHAEQSQTDIFIYPGYKFRAIDGLITNFHLPESTLLMLVSAFLGYDFTMDVYKNAMDNKYRFFSFGDAMLIV